ncbi:MAG TPA: AMP-binding protein [Candidatus Binataceae bacterium]|nr:AMP-binding protein [Candidatus Binataceae bacterium]
MTDSATPHELGRDAAPVWFPSAEYTAGSHAARLMRALGIDLDPARPEAAWKLLYHRSIADPETFWRKTLDLIGVEWMTPFTRVLDASAGVQWPRWFVGGRLNLTHNAVFRHLATPRTNQPAIIWEGEDGAVVRLTFAELAREVARAANALRALGIGRGDRVGLFLPMLPETAIAALAIAHIGAIFIPIFSGYGADAAAVRLQDSQAKLLITADGFYRRGQTVPLAGFARQAAQTAGCVQKIVVVRRMNRSAAVSGALHWDEVIASASDRAPVEPMESMDPFMLIYTSGTTGKPKGTVHYHAGFPLKSAQDMAHLFDLRPGEVMFWFTDMGWMMGPWLILGALTLGATAFMYEGAPDYPYSGRVWAMVARHKVTHLGISPTLVRALMPSGAEPVHRHNLSSLRILGSTGEVWNPEAYMWLFETAGGHRCPIINYSGGTEVAGGLLGCTVFRPIKPCGFNTAVPGVQTVALDDRGKPVVDAVGELAALNTWPGITKGFWHDPDRYLETYWSRFQGLWVHGDWAMLDRDGHWFLLGRSDDTLKIAGKRVGPAEVESAASQFPAVRESAAIGVPHPTKGEAAVLFVVLLPGHEASIKLAEQIADKVAEILGKPLRPQQVYFVPDLPKTRNAKIMRRLVRAVHLGNPPGDLSGLENPAAIEQIPRAPE